LPIVKAREIKAGASLIIETTEVKTQNTNPKVQTATTAVAETKTIVKPAAVQTATAEINNRGSLGSLTKIREQLSKKNLSTDNTSKEITDENLQSAWNVFIEKLAAKNNHSAVTNFKLATLKVINNNSIEITTNGEIHKAFIESERAELSLHLQTTFNNRILVYQVVVIETQNDDEVPADQPLSTKQQYLKIVEEYPLVKELRDRLKLELG